MKGSVFTEKYQKADNDKCDQSEIRLHSPIIDKNNFDSLIYGYALLPH